MSSVARERVRLAELVALLSLGTDLGLGQPMEHMIRACLIALRLGERLGSGGVRARRRLLLGSAGVGRVPHRRLRAGEVVRGRHDAEARRALLLRHGQGRARRSRSCSGMSAGPSDRWLRAPGSGLAFMGDGLRAMKCARGEPLPRDRRARRASRPRRGRAREPSTELRALGWQGRVRDEGRGDRASARG